MREDIRITVVFGLGLLTVGLPTLSHAPTLAPLDPILVLAPGGTPSPGIERAKAKYVERGNEYIWGANDCSRFVLDLWFAQGLETDVRLTTQVMADQRFMRSLGFALVEGVPRTGDVWTFRYPNARGREAGHCGVLVRQGFEPVYLHNTAARNGLHVDTARGFADLLASLDCAPEDVLWWRFVGN